MMTNFADLKTKAEAAMVTPWATIEHPTMWGYIAAASPETILALIARLERAEARNPEICG